MSSPTPRSSPTSLPQFETTGLGVEASALVGSLARDGVRAETHGGRWIRLVTHMGVSDEDLQVALAAIERTVRHVLRG
ncbi:hypothetical protein ACFCYB_30835 [Streptomyces sp. NPDC056309]|uniref:hypothetical protein n=1 Tax=unclassified Streptomyces TaxID=2593676 RepID=UPI0035DC142C